MQDYPSAHKATLNDLKTSKSGRVVAQRERVLSRYLEYFRCFRWNFDVSDLGAWMKQVRQRDRLRRK
jgi:hypothetical protein